MKIIGLLVSVLLCGCMYVDVNTDIPDGGLIQVPEPIQNWFDRKDEQSGGSGGLYDPNYAPDASVPYVESDCDAGL
jgi:hypothetical protein